MAEPWFIDDVQGNATLLESTPDYSELAHLIELTEDGKAWFQIPCLPAVTRPIWHYTDAYALESILRTGRLRATSTMMLNDRKEIEYGLDLLERAVSEVTEPANRRHARQFGTKVVNQAREDHRANRIFVICASLKGDDLSQWRGYGSGYALGMDARALAPISNFPIRAGHEDQSWRWTRVLYRQRDWQEWIYRVAHTLVLLHDQIVNHKETSNVNEALASETLWQVIPYLKHVAFRREAEVRLAFRCHRGFPLKFNPSGRYGIAAFIECGLPLDPGENTGPVYFSYSENDRLPINYVRLGPSQSSRSLRSGLRTVLQHHGYHGVKALTSKIPFR